MKIAISIHEQLLGEADVAARRMGISRSRLPGLAVSDFLRREQREQMLRRLNEVYATGSEPAEKRLLRGIRARIRPALEDRW